MDLVAICVGRFDLSLIEAKRCTPVDFEIYNQGYSIKTQEKTRLIALQAWMNQAVQRTKKRGKSTVSAFKDFNEFYDSEAEFNKLFESEISEKPKVLTLADKNRILSQRRKKGG